MASTSTITVAPPSTTGHDNRHSAQQRILELVSSHEVQSSPAHRPNTTTSAPVEVDWPSQVPEFDPTLAAHPTVPWPVTNPSWWERSYRRVPDYRPVNYELDLAERAQPVPLRIGGYLVIGGCQIMSHFDSLWRQTLGRFTDAKVWRVGGEW